MSFATNREFLVRSMKQNGKFRDRFVSALRGRLAPNTGLTVDQLAYAIGMHGESVRNWLRGDTGISSEAVDAVILFFSKDPTFLVEIYPQCTPLVAAKREHEKAYALVQGLKDLWQTEAAA